ncbi:alpha-1,2-fucosyltransferase [bacterium]|nr:alpha-1,2-fucosyltransferase [Actinomycetota bacterium]NDG31091.1 alpha-1,2-fucosyltransferase [bacterium]
MPVIVPYLMGGLGNQLFQVASACTFSSLTGNQIYLSYNHRQSSPHTDKDYFRNVFKKLNREQVNIPLLPVNEGPKLQSFDVEKYLEIAKQKNTLLFGYFQNWKFIPTNFKDYLQFENSDLLKKYPDIQERCFIHVRGGDYVNHQLHDVGLKGYYQKCIEDVQERRGITKIAIFTNDMEYCKKQEFLNTLDCIRVDENELDSLYLMTQCRACIMANSTFSWWGAFLNRNRPIYMPSKWFNDPEYNISGYFFPGCIIVSV